MSNENRPFFRPSIGIEEEKAVLRVLRSKWLTTGKEAFAFEKEFADYVGAKYAFAVNSSTSGLGLAMDAIGVSYNTSIITTPYTFASTALSAEHLGAKIIYADIEQDSYNIDPYAIEKALKNATANGNASIKAVVPVHIAGNVCNMEMIKQVVHNTEIQNNNGKIAIIEDTAHAFPAKTKAGFAGTLGDIGVYSFYVKKTITTGEGGMVCTNIGGFAKRIQIMRLHGIDRPVWNRYTSEKTSWEYDVTECGFKYNLPDILAAIGREQLKKADAFYESRKEIMRQYSEAFSKYNFLQIPPDGEGNARHLYLLRIVPEKLQERGVGISVHFIPHFFLDVFYKKIRPESR
jgi:dTDP-4-amino-4,6-dideoxygalactose transaminase